MNLIHVEYAVIVAQEGSVSKASQKLMIAQSNLSRAIKQLETDLGLTIFTRTKNGMYLTPQGKSFIQDAQKILQEIEALKAHAHSTNPKPYHFFVSAPRASYISSAFCKLVREAQSNDVQFCYEEADSLQILQNLTEKGHHVAILRCNESNQIMFHQLLKEKGLTASPLLCFHSSLLISQDSPLAKLPVLRWNDLSGFTEILSPEPNSAACDPGISHQLCPCFLPDRAAQYEMLRLNPRSFLLASPVPQHTLQNENLIQRVLSDHAPVHQDLLIFPQQDSLTDLDQLFLEKLKETIQECIDPYSL